MAFNRLLCPIDFSKHSESCVRRGLQLVGGDGDFELHLLYVLHTPTDYSAYEGNPQAEVERRLQEFVRELGLDPTTTTIAMAKGHTSTEICQYAKQHDCDLIMMATHGRTGLAHMLLGSTTEQVVRHAPCPVLTMRDGHK